MNTTAKHEIRYKTLRGLLLTGGGIILLFLMILAQNLFRSNSFPGISAVLPILLLFVFQGLAMYLYLDSLHLNPSACFLSSVCYGYCGYSLAACSEAVCFAGTFNGIWSAGGILVLFPLLLRGIEKWLEQGKTFLLVLSLGLTCIYSVYFFYCAGLLAAGYLVVRLRRKKAKILPKLTLFAGFAILVCLLCAFFLSARTDAANGVASPLGRTAWDADFSLFVPRFKMWFTALARTLGNDILGNPYSNAYRGYGGDYFQVSTCYSAFLITLAWVYYQNRKDMRKRFLSGLLLVFGLTAFPAVSLILSAFSGIQTLWMFLFPVMQTLLAAFALDSVFRKGGLKCKTILQGMLLSFACLFLCQTALSIGLNDFGGNLKIYLLLSLKHLLRIGVLHFALFLFCLLEEKNLLFVFVLFCLFGIDIMINCRHLYFSDFAAEAFSYGNITGFVYTPASGGVFGAVISLCSAILIVFYCLVCYKKRYRLSPAIEQSILHIEASGISSFRRLLSSLALFFSNLCRKKVFTYAVSFLLSLAFVLGTFFLFTPETFAWNGKWILTIAVGSLLCFIPVTGFLFHVRQNAAVYQKRSSNIELCRVFCMFLVVLHHYALHGGSFFLSGMSTNKLYAMFLIPGGKLSYVCFLAISCWFLADQKFSTGRFIRTWLQVLFYTVSVSAAACFVSGYLGMTPPLNFSRWIGAFLPLSGNSHSFAACYLALYLLMPFLARMTENLSKRQARWLMLLLFYLETATQIISSFIQYRNSLFSDLLLFLLCYIIAFNLKHWPIKIMENSKVLLCLFALAWLAMWMVEYAYNVYPDNQLLVFIEANMLGSYSVNNLIGGFSLFFLFKNLKLNRPIPLINALASGTFGILLIHDHNFFRNLLWGHLINTPAWHASDLMILHSLAAALWIFIVCFAIDWLRKSLLEKHIMKSRKLSEFCGKCDIMINEKEVR